MSLQVSKKVSTFLYTMCAIITVLSVIYERRSFLSNAQSVIEAKKSMIDRELYMRLLSRVADGNYLVTRKDSKLFRYLGETDTFSGIYLVGSWGNYRRVSLEKVPYLNPRAKYFFVDIKDFLIHRMFLKHNLKSFMYTKSFNLENTKNEVALMSEISQECLKILDKVGSTEIAMEDMIVRLRKGSPDELFVEHAQGLSIIKSVFKNENEFLEGLKAHFMDFMDSVFFGMEASSFCDSYVKSVINYLEREDVLLLSPSIKMHPELIHYLFPYKMVSERPNLLHNQLVAGGISLNGVQHNNYLKKLFNLKKIEKITEGGCRFIFTAHISMDIQKKKYSITFV
ncbi:hypothetical protein KMI_06g09980 [Encephalitozoon hellem]|nr:hypothetical protein KMI_06g09980 [Encephalitozoon hellem]